MKTFLMGVLISLVCSVASTAQIFNSSKVPEAAKVSFHLMYPNAKHIVWSKDEAGYNARFDINHKTFFAIYDAGGNTLAEVVEVKKENLPIRVLKQLRENYRSFVVKGAVMIKSMDGKIIYEAHIASNTEAYDMTFNTSGYMLTVVPEPAVGVDD